MAFTVEPAKHEFPKPPRTWSDPLISALRTNRAIVIVYFWITDGLIPFLFAVFLVLPIGALLLLIFIPKFIRNQCRRKKYDVCHTPDPAERIRGTSSPAPLAKR